jgi:hypothetical protein
MATGRKAFSGTSQASLISAIMKEDPAPIATLQPMTPPALDRIVRTCLAKDPEERWQSAHDLKSELAWIAQAGSQTGVAAPVAASRRRKDRLAWGVVGAIAGAVLAAAGAWAVLRSRPVVTRPVTRVAVPVPAGDSLITDNYSTVAISPEGRRVVYAGRRADKRQLFRGSLDAAEAVPITSTEGLSPFFSPDGQWVGFWVDGRSEGGPVQRRPVTICRCGVAIVSRGHRGTDDTMSFRRGGRAACFGLRRRGRRSRNEITMKSRTADTSGRNSFRTASRSSTRSSPKSRGYAIAVVSLATGESKILIKGGTYGRYAASGHLLYARGGTLFAAPLDAGKREVTGAAFPVAEGVLPVLQAMRSSAKFVFWILAIAFIGGFLLFQSSGLAGDRSGLDVA